MSLEERLAKIKSPNLQNQQHTRVVLTSVEETLQQHGTEFTPTAYFAALLAVLQQSASGPPNLELLTSTFYLLDLVSSHVPPPLLRTQYSPIVSLLHPVFSTSPSAPLLKSAIGCLESLLVAQDSAAWNLASNQTGPRQLVPVLLTLSVDDRPKIRKRSLEALRHVLQSVPRGPALDHPAAELCASTALLNLTQAVGPQPTKRKKQDDHEARLIHALQLIKALPAACGGWPAKNLEALVQTLMTLCKSSNEYLVVSSFEVFEAIFEHMGDEVSSAKLPRLLEAIRELRPTQNDAHTLPSWFAVLSRGYILAGGVMPEDTFAGLSDLVDLVAPFLTQPSHSVRIAASECLISLFEHCVPASVVLEPSVYDEKICEKLGKQAIDLLSMKYQSAWMEVFSALSALFEALRWHSGRYLEAVIETIGELRGNESFQGKKEADRVLGAAIQHAGPECVLSILPLNLQDSKKQGRAWLLPLLRDNVYNAKIAQFRAVLMPLSEKIYGLILEHGEAEKTPRIKVYETIVYQIWSALPRYCLLPLDLTEAVDQPFAELISNLLYQQSHLRVDLCRGLQNLVESNKALLASELPASECLYEYRLTGSQAAANLEHLAGLSSNLLAVLFNVYSQTTPQHRGYILECINAYLSITTEKDLVDTFTRVSMMLEGEIDKVVEQPQGKGEMPPTSHTLLDLVIALSIYLPVSTFPALFTLSSRILTHSTLSKNDPQLIKKAYKLIPRLATSENGAQALEARTADLQSLMLSITETPVPARRDRLLTIITIISTLPVSHLHFIPSILSEVILACKDGNQRAREAGFTALLAAAARIINPANPPNTTIHNRLVPHMPDDAPDAPATVEEVFTMVSAGLAGVAPHMIAASIAALARLTYEYHTSLPPAFLAELVGTVELFISSNTREIVRAVLGFVKVVVVALPDSLLTEERMRALMKGCMLWSGENKGRMRQKVKGILERCIRRFGAERVESWMAGDEGGKKFVTNIRKRRERAKRGKTKTAEEGGSGESGGEEKPEYSNAFDAAVYGSDEDSDILFGSDGEKAETQNGDSASKAVSFKKGSKNTHSSRTNGKDDNDNNVDDDDDDEPLDLLTPGALSSISRPRGHGQGLPLPTRRKRSRINADGKLVFGDVDADADADTEMPDGAGVGSSSRDAVDAYLDAVSGPSAVRRVGRGGRLKMEAAGKRVKQGKGDEMDVDGDVEVSEAEARAVGRATGGSSRGRGTGRSGDRGAGRGGNRGRGKFGKFPERRGLGVQKQRTQGGTSTGGGRVFRAGGGSRGGSRGSFGGRGGGSGRSRGGGGGGGRGGGIRRR